jgi:hypothetical protein
MHATYCFTSFGLRAARRNRGHARRRPRPLRQAAIIHDSQGIYVSKARCCALHLTASTAATATFAPRAAATRRGMASTRCSISSRNGAAFKDPRFILWNGSTSITWSRSVMTALATGRSIRKPPRALRQFDTPGNGAQLSPSSAIPCFICAGCSPAPIRCTSTRPSSSASPTLRSPKRWAQYTTSTERLATPFKSGSTDYSGKPHAADSANLGASCQAPSSGALRQPPSVISRATSESIALPRSRRHVQGHIPRIVGHVRRTPLGVERRRRPDAGAAISAGSSEIGQAGIVIAAAHAHPKAARRSNPSKGRNTISRNTGAHPAPLLAVFGDVVAVQAPVRAHRPGARTTRRCQRRGGTMGR